MRRNRTEESIASEILFDYFSNLTNCKVHSWHPPDSKAYFTRLLHIARDGKRSHFDLIVQIKEVLYLIEVKDSLSNSYDDVVKLKEITTLYSTQDLIKKLSLQGATFDIQPNQTKIVIAAKKSDASFIEKNSDLCILLSDEMGVTGLTQTGRALIIIAEAIC